MIIWGSGSYSAILIDLFNLNSSSNVHTIIDPFSINTPHVSNLISTNFAFHTFLPDLSSQSFVVAVGDSYGYQRTQYFQYLQHHGHTSLRLWHYSSFLSPSSRIENTTVIMPNVSVMPFTEIGHCCILNTSSTIDHECFLGVGVHIMGSSYVAGRVHIGNYSTIGSNSTIFPDVRIGSNVFVGAGSVVRKNIPDNTIYVGNPAKFLKLNSPLPSSIAIRSPL